MDKSPPSLHLLVQRHLLHTLQYPPDTPLPPSLFSDERYSFVSVTRSPGEVTVVVGVSEEFHERQVETKLEKDGEGCTMQVARNIKQGEGELWDLPRLGRASRSAGPWRAFRVRGPLDLSLTGIMNELTKPLRTASVPVYALSTWDTDYLLVPSSKFTEAAKALEDAGWTLVLPKAVAEG